MKPPSVASSGFFEPLLSNRYFQLLFWTFSSGLIVLIASLLLIHYGPVNSMEAALLDLKSRYRANNFPSESMTPSKDIVILGIDSNTDKYIRLHPDEELSTTIPRGVLAKVLNYLTDQGVRAVIFDLEFKEPKEGDDALAVAMARNGHAYAADRMDDNLVFFENDQRQFIRMGQHQYGFDTYLSTGVLMPYLTYLAELKNRFMPFKSVSPLDLGSGGTAEPFPNLGGFAPDGQAPRFLEKRSAQLSRQQWIQKSIMPNHSLTPPPLLAMAQYQDVVERAFNTLCTHVKYEDYYKNTPEFLRFLEQKRLLMDATASIPDSINRKITRCSTFPIVNRFLPVLRNIGVPSIDYDDDAYLRSVTTVYRGYKGNFYTYLGIRPALDILGVSHVSYTPTRLQLDNRFIPLTDGEKVYINWRNPRFMIERILADQGINPAQYPDLQAEIKLVDGSRNNPLLNGGHIYRQISMIDVVQLAQGKSLTPEARARMHNIPVFEPSGEFSFKDKIVIVGNTLTDVHRTPVSNTTFGPEVVAAALDMFLHDSIFIQPPPAWIQWGLVGILALAIAAAIVRFENMSVGLAVAIILMTLYWVINLLVFVYWGYSVELIVPSFILGFALAIATLYRYYVHDQEKHHLTNVFSKYVSPQIMGEIVKNPAKAMDNLKGGKKELTVLFSDLQGFTQQFENADPELMVSQLNEYFDSMTEIILAHGGTYDKYMGDSIMAFFGAPADLPEHALRACQAAVEMQNALQALNEAWAAIGSKILTHGIGISTGEMFVGNFGSKNIKNFTVMGSNVNLGSRLEAYTRIAHWPIIISERTAQHAGTNIQTTNLGHIQVKGFTNAVQIHGLTRVHNTVVLQGNNTPPASTQEAS